MFCLKAPKSLSSVSDFTTDAHIIMNFQDVKLYSSSPVFFQSSSAEYSNLFEHLCILSHPTLLVGCC